MKKIVFSLMFVSVLSFANNSVEIIEEDPKAENEVEQYYCPMECEGDKTYTDANTKCPVCKMSLVKKKTKQGKASDDTHKGHKH